MLIFRAEIGSIVKQKFGTASGGVSVWRCNGMLMDVSRAQARFVSTVERYSTRSCLMRGPLCRSDEAYRNSVRSRAVFTLVSLAMLSAFTMSSFAATDWSTITKTSSVATPGFASGLALSSNGR